MDWRGGKYVSKVPSGLWGAPDRGRGVRRWPSGAGHAGGPRGGWHLGESCLERTLRARRRPAGRPEGRTEPSVAAVPRKRVGAQGRGGRPGDGVRSPGGSLLHSSPAPAGLALTVLPLAP